MIRLPSEINNPSAYLENDEWAISQKMDGHRLLIQSGHSEIKGYNRSGDERSIPMSIYEEIESITDSGKHRITLDGELLNKVYWVFDIMAIEHNDVSFFDLSTIAFVDRQTILANILPDSDYIRHVPVYYGTAKAPFYDECIESNVEGVVFNKVNSRWCAGRTTEQVKYKFIKDVDCVVIDKSHNGHDNFTLGVYDNEHAMNMVEVGKVSALTGDGKLLSIGDVVTVQCLYASSSYRLVQPTMPRLRSDKWPEQCLLNQLDAIMTNKGVVTL